jgi:glycosyltransferase involved in cell wall biosynthesis
VDHKKNGYLAEPFESEDLIKGIEWILEDKERHKQLSYNARQKVLENFDSEVVIPKYVELYKSINKHK